MFDLEAAIRAWKAALASERTLAGADLDELEDHLRCRVESLLMAGGVDEQGALERARESIGRPAELSAEFGKVGGGPWRKLLTVGWALYTLAWFLPVHRYGTSLLDFNVRSGILPGVEAFLTALTQGGPVAVASALTNFVMLLTMWRVSDQGRPRILWLALAMCAASCVNAWWMSEITDLRIGYFAWWVSFCVVSVGLVLRARAITPSPSAATE